MILAYLSSTTFWSRLANPFDVAKWNWNAPREFCDGGNHDLNRPRLHLAEYSRSRISLHFLKTTSRIYWAPCRCSRDYSALQFRKPDTMHAIICIFLQKRLRDLHVGFPQTCIDYRAPSPSAVYTIGHDASTFEAPARHQKRENATATLQVLTDVVIQILWLKHCRTKSRGFQWPIPNMRDSTCTLKSSMRWELPEKEPFLSRLTFLAATSFPRFGKTTRNHYTKWWIWWLSNIRVEFRAGWFDSTYMKSGWELLHLTCPAKHILIRCNPATKLFLTRE